MKNVSFGKIEIKRDVWKFEAIVLVCLFVFFSFNYLDSGSCSPQNPCDAFEPSLPSNLLLGKLLPLLSSTFNLWVRLLTRDSRVENKFSAVRSSKPSSSSSSPDDRLSACSGGCLVGRELRNLCICLWSRSSLSLRILRVHINKWNTKRVRRNNKMCFISNFILLLYYIKCYLKTL